MFHHFARISVAVITLVMAGEAAAPVGTMITSGEVTVGGAGVQAKAVSSRPALAGDEIVTSKGALAIVYSPKNGRVEVRGNSRATIESDHVALHEGTVAAERSQVRFADIAVEAKSGDDPRPWFVVTCRDEERRIAAVRGAVWIRTAGAAPILVPAGSFAASGTPSADKNNSSKKEKEEDDDDKAAAPVGSEKGGSGGKGATAAGAATTGGWTIASLSHGASVALAVGAVGAATGGAIAGVKLAADDELEQRSPSSSQ
jgi:hypothetical protein